MEDSLYHRDLPDGRTLIIWPLTFGRARLVIGPTGARYYNDAW